MLINSLIEVFSETCIEVIRMRDCLKDINVKEIHGSIPAPFFIFIEMLPVKI